MNPANPFEAFWAWWWPSLVSWLPKTWQSIFLQARHPIEVIWDDAGTGFADRTDLAKADAIILLPRRHALVRELRLPANAARELRNVCRFEVERQTPFAVEQVYFDAPLKDSRNRNLSQVLVTLVVVPKSILDPILDLAKTSIPHLLGVDVMGEDQHAIGANVLPAALRYQPPLVWRRWNITLMLLILIACVGAMVGLLHARQHAVEMLQVQAEPVLAQAARTKAREAQLEEVQREGSNADLPGQPIALELLSGLSAALPRDSYLIHMRLSDGVLAVRGRTQDLSAMLVGLRTSPLWSEPKLTGTRALEDGHEQEFSLELPVRAGNERVSR